MEAAVATETEEDKVLLHRIGCFLGLGYGLEEAEVLASSDVDHHELQALLLKGCARGLAAEILF